MARKSRTTLVNINRGGQPVRPDERRDGRTREIQRQLHNAWIGRHLGAAPQDLRPNTAD